uniref:Uncharacterized protein n=1 Tax=Oryza sativa subsp. japonica TaxID=39947 RepID=Q6EUG2_ORYSJ|nr:hypothetical protein [Oryza sativa Japonica Group]
MAVGGKHRWVARREWFLHSCRIEGQWVERSAGAWKFGWLRGGGVLGVSSMTRAARDKEDGRGPHCCPAWEGGEGEEEEAS